MPDPVLGVISQTQNKWIVFSYIYESKKQQRGGEPANWKRCCPGLHSASMINTTDSLVTQRPRWYPNWTPKRKIINNYRILHPVWIINHLKKLVDPRAGGDCIFFFSKRGCFQHWKYWWNDLMSANNLKGREVRSSWVRSRGRLSSKMECVGDSFYSCWNFSEDSNLMKREGGLNEISPFPCVPFSYTEWNKAIIQSTH